MNQHKNNLATSDERAPNQSSNLRNILVAIDFSIFSERALAYALTLAEKLGAKITLIHVVEPSIVPITLMMTTETEVDVRVVRERQQMLETLRRDKINPGYSSEAIVKTGEPWEKIIEEAKTLRSELIITASHGHSAWEDIPLGNTAEKVMSHAACSVLTVRQSAVRNGSPSAPMVCLNKILVPIDFSVASELALAFAAILAKLFGAEIFLEHVIEIDPLQAALGYLPHEVRATDGKMLKDAEDVLARLGKRDIPSDIPRQIVVRVGRPVKAIAEAVETLKADLIIITSHGYKGLKGVLLGSTTEHVVRHASCAVWTLRG